MSQDSAQIGYDVPMEHRVSKSQRQELQRLFELGQRILVSEPDKADEAGRRFQYCVEHDPRNRIYVEAFLQTLEKIHPAPPPKQRRWFDRQKSAWRAARQVSDSPLVLARGPAMLARNPWDATVLLPMVCACQEFGYLEAALRYLQNALDDAEHAAEAHAQYARTLAWTGRFSTAVSCWDRVLELSPHNEEALQMRSLLWQESSSSLAPLPEDIESCLQLARDRMKEKDFDSAHHYLAHGNTLAAGHLPTQDLAETIQLEQADHRLETARRLHEMTPCPATYQLVDDYSANRHRVALEVFNARSLRYPGEHRWRLELARVLRALEKAGQAVDVLAEIPTEDPLGAVARLEQGECLQLQRDFASALTCYRQAQRRQAELTTYGGIDGEGATAGDVGARITQRLERLEAAMDSSDRG
jgi:tetratricopeptide (TPR) repeat protein